MDIYHLLADACQKHTMSQAFNCFGGHWAVNHRRAGSTRWSRIFFRGKGIWEKVGFPKMVALPDIDLPSFFVNMRGQLNVSPPGMVQNVTGRYQGGGTRKYHTQ